MIDMRRGDGEWVALGDYLTAADHLQILSMHGETGELEMSNGECLGTLFLRHGEVVEAVCARCQVTGLDASLCLMCMSEGRCRYRRANHAHPNVIHEPTAALLLDAARWTDEGRRLCQRDRVGHGEIHAEWVLLIDFGPEGRAVPLEQRKLRIGRSGECDVVVLMRSVSRLHAEIEASGDKVILRDLGSTNGTLVNGRPIWEAHVDPDDEIRFGDVRARLVTKADAMTLRKTERLPVTSVVGYADTMHIGPEIHTARKARAA